MKQKIVIKLGVASDKSQSKAMVLAAKAGVSKMGITGDDKDLLEVEGDGVDAVCLVKCLRRKLGHAEILQVEEVKPPEEKKKPEEPKVVPLPYWYPYPYYHHYHQPQPWC